MDEAVIFTCPVVATNAAIPLFIDQWVFVAL